MHFSSFLTAASFAATAVVAAPRGTGFTRWLARQQSHADREALRYRDQRLEAEARHALHRRSHNETNTTTTIIPGDGHPGIKLPIDDEETVTIDCPLPPVVVSTTTVDVTVYITETPSAVPTEDSETTLIDETESTVTTDYDEETTPVVIVIPSSTVITEFVTTTSICDDGTPTTIVITQTTTEPCDETITASSPMSTSGVPTTSESLSTFILTPNVTSHSSTLSTVTSTPSQSTLSISSLSGSSSMVTSTPGMISPSNSVTLPPTTSGNSSSTTDCETDMTTPTPTPVATYSTCIDVNITPITTSKLTITLTSPHEPTRTVCVDDHETGKPEEDALYCGVNGRPAGVGFIAEFIEERSGVPVTEEGCYQFCDSVMESTDGCQSYRFYHNELGAPRCALYGMPVATVLYDLDENYDDTWYDLACGSPSDESWYTIVPGESSKTTHPTTLATSSTPAASEAVTTETPVVSEPVTTGSATTKTPAVSEYATTETPIVSEPAATEIPVVSEPATTETSATIVPTTTSSHTPAPTHVSDDDNTVNEPIDNSGTIWDSGNVDSGNGNVNSGNNDSFNNNDNNDNNNNNSGSLVDIDIGGLTG